MFSVNELTELSNDENIQNSKGLVREMLLCYRVGKNYESQIFKIKGQIREISHFASLVLGSVALSNELDLIEWSPLCQLAADFEFILYLVSGKKLSNLRRSAILYDLAGMPGIAATMSDPKLFSPLLHSFMSRKYQFGKLGFEKIKEKNSELINVGSSDDINYQNIDVSERGLDETLSMLGDFMQTFQGENYTEATQGIEILLNAAKDFNLKLSADECAGISKLMAVRNKSSISNYHTNSLSKRG